jgi:hypothetical protein
MRHRVVEGSKPLFGVYLFQVQASRSSVLHFFALQENPECHQLMTDLTVFISMAQPKIKIENKSLLLYLRYPSIFQSKADGTRLRDLLCLPAASCMTIKNRHTPEIDGIRLSASCQGSGHAPTTAAAVAAA